MSKAKCLNCGTVLESKHRHHWVTCGCSNETFIDGGDEYRRSGGKDLSLIEWIEEDEPKAPPVHYKGSGFTGAQKGERK